MNHSQLQRSKLLPISVQSSKQWSQTWNWMIKKLSIKSLPITIFMQWFGAYVVEFPMSTILKCKTLSKIHSLTSHSPELKVSLTILWTLKHNKGFWIGQLRFLNSCLTSRPNFSICWSLQLIQSNIRMLHSRCYQLKNQWYWLEIQELVNRFWLAICWLTSKKENLFRPFNWTFQHKLKRKRFSLLSRVN